MTGIVETLDIRSSGNLDAITVYFRNYALGQGDITIVCYGSAWSAYFGGMGSGIKAFVKHCDTAYLAERLGSAATLKQSRGTQAYLERIVAAVQAALPQIAVTE